MTNYYATLEQIVNHIKDGPKYGRKELAIWGGQCTEQDVLDFLEGWQLNRMSYRIWEYVSEITFNDKDTLPKNVSLLEHGRLFGEGGDLTLRRDGAIFRWHFICEKDTQPAPPASGNPKGFWEVEANKGLQFHRWEDKALLWGEYKKELGRWHDDRVARARLTYPIDWQPKDKDRVMIKYWTFSQAGQVQFVWFRGLEKWEEVQDGNG